MKVIGLTGGIGTGKSTVSSYLKEKGCKIIDTDGISRQITSDDQCTINKIRKAFGDEVFENGKLNRALVATIVFNDKNQKKLLEEIVTKRVIEISLDMIDACRKDEDSMPLIVDAPLLFEFGLEKYVDETWLVTAKLEIRLDRVMKRDGHKKDHILSRINNQMADEEKAKRATYILDNSRDHDYLYKQIDALLERNKNEVK